MPAHSDLPGLFSRTGVRYEVALGVLDELTVHYAALIGSEREQPAPDSMKLRQAAAIQSQLGQLRDELNVSEEDEVLECNEPGG